MKQKLLPLQSQPFEILSGIDMDRWMVWMHFYTSNKYICGF